MNGPHLRKSTAIALALLAVVSATGCYSFRATRKDIADKEAQLRRLQDDINQESNRRKTLEQDTNATQR